MPTWLFPLDALPAPSMGTAVLVALLVGAAGALYAYATRHFAYWRRRGVPFLRPLPIAGNLKDVLLFRKQLGKVLFEVYTQMKDQPYVGMFFFDQPVLFIKDVELWKNVVIKDFEYFEDRGFSPLQSAGIFSESLFGAKGKKWRRLRSKLSPAFTLGKIKRFYILLEEKATNLDHYFDDVAKEGVPCDVSNACARYAMDAIATVGFGIDTTALTDDDDPLHRLLRKIFTYSKIFTLVSVATFVDMPLLRLLNVSLVPAPLAAFLRRNVWGAASQRQSAGTQGQRGDFLDLLLELRDKGRIAADEGDDGDKHAPDNSAAIYMDGDVLIGQAFSIFAAGFDTTSTTMSFALYELAKDEIIQEKLRTLLQKAVEQHDGKLTYDALQSVDYLDMIFSETLRKYPVLPFLDRTCTKAYRIPGTDVVLDKGVFAFTSTLGIQRDPQYFPDPERFDPERFSDANKGSIPSCCYMPFGEGPHRCIGIRLAYLQGKLGLAHIILNYRLHPCAATPEKIEFNLHSFLISSRDGVPVKLTRVKND